MIWQEIHMRLRAVPLLAAAVFAACSCPPRPPAPSAPSATAAPAPAREDATTLQGHAPADFAPAGHVHPPQPCILASPPSPQDAGLAIAGAASVGTLEARSLTVKGTPVRLRGGRNLLDWDAAAAGLRPRAPGGAAPRVRLEPGDSVEGDATVHVESGPGGADLVYGAPVPVTSSRRYAVRAAARLVSGEGTFALAFECLRADRTVVGPCVATAPATLPPGRWTEVEGTFDGEGDGPGRLPPGTAFVRPGFRANSGSAAGGATRVARLELYELEAPAACAWRAAAVEEDAPLAARCRPTEVAQGMRIQRRRDIAAPAAMAAAEPTASLSLEILCCTLR